MILHQRTPELLPPTAADRAAGVRLTKIDEEEKTSTTNRSARSTYPKKKSVSTSEAARLFTGDLEAAGWEHMLRTNPGFRTEVATTHVLIAAHHGRENGIYPELFGAYRCRPQIVVISDDYHQYDTQQTVAFYRSKCIGITGFRGQDQRHVLTTRRDGAITFSTTPTGVIAL